MIVSFSIDVQLLPVSEPFWQNEEYLVVVDYNQQNVYQLKPDSGEVRAIPMRPCHPVSVTFDPYIYGLYVICVHSDSRYHIRKKTFDDRIDKNIYDVPEGYVRLSLFQNFHHLNTTMLCDGRFVYLFNR